MRFTMIAILFFFSINSFAWDSVGHRIIAQIAYDQLTPQAKKAVDGLTNVMFHSRYPESRFLKASTWPDQIKSQTTQYNAWHYIDLPFDRSGGVSDHVIASDNVVWAILHAEKIVEDNNESQNRRAKYLSFLIHFIGDIHQPMHCVTLYNTHFPQGDQGGNLYPIVSPIATNLHALWDRGLGLFISPKGEYQFHYDQVEQIARQWMAQYPKSFFAVQLQATTPQQWAMESHQIAVTFAYSLPIDAEPSQQYIQQGQTIVREQIVLAGDRLAMVLNRVRLKA